MVAQGHVQPPMSTRHSAVPVRSLRLRPGRMWGLKLVSAGSSGTALRLVKIRSDLTSTEPVLSSLVWSGVSWRPPLSPIWCQAPTNVGPY